MINAACCRSGREEVSLIRIERMKADHRETVLHMMRTFYASPAVHTNGSEEIFCADLDHCLHGSPYLEGYVFLEKDAVVGYSMIAKSFSTEYGKSCIWVEDLYLTPDCRGKGIAAVFFSFLERQYPDAVLRLEVEAENANAVHAYRKSGFDSVPYMQMKKLQ